MTWAVRCETCGPLGVFTDCGPEERARYLADTHEAFTGHPTIVDPPPPTQE